MSLHRPGSLSFFSFLLLQVFVLNQLKSNYLYKIIMLNIVKFGLMNKAFLIKVMIMENSLSSDA